MSKFSRDEAPTVAPKFDMETYARESERHLTATPAAPAQPVSSGPIPKAPPTGLDLDFEYDVEPTTVPVLLSRERALEMASLPTESFLLAFIDGTRNVSELASLTGIPRDLVAVTIAEMARGGVVRLR